MRFEAQAKAEDRAKVGTHKTLDGPEGGVGGPQAAVGSQLRKSSRTTQPDAAYKHSVSLFSPCRQLWPTRCF